MLINAQFAQMDQSDPMLHLLVNDILTYPDLSEGNVIEFHLSEPPMTAWLRSRAHRPARSQMSSDGRVLGFSVWSISASDGTSTRHFEPPDFAGVDGFYEPEKPRHIWTNGNAALPGWIFAGLSGAITLRIEGDGLGHYPAECDSAMALSDLMRGVLSLGENCDVGFAQSHFDAEPLDLLRWANSTIDQLCFGLRSGFAGLGEPAHTRIVWVGSEYRLVDLRYASFHTMAFERADAAGEERLLEDGCRRLAFLRRKLLHDLAEGRRLVVYRTNNPAFGRAERRELWSALCGLGAARLLVLTPASRPSMLGEVVAMGDGLYSGGFDPQDSREAGFEALMRMCRRARELIRGDATG